MTALTLSFVVVVLWVAQLVGLAVSVVGPTALPSPAARLAVLVMYATLVLLPLLFYVDLKDTSTLAKRQGNTKIGWAALCVAVPAIGSTLVVPGMYVAEYVLAPVGTRTIGALERIFK